MNTNGAMSWRMFAGLITVGLISGSAFTSTKLLTGELSTVNLAQGRLMMAAVSVLAVMALRRVPLAVTPGSIARVSALAMLDGVVPYTLVSWAAASVDAGIAAILVATMPLFTAVIAAATMKDERLTVSGIVGIAVSVSGVAALTGPGSLDANQSSTLGMVAVVVAAASYGAGTVYARFLLRTGDPVSITGTKLVLATIFLAPVTLANGEGTAVVSLSAEGWASLAALGVAATGLGRCLYLWVVKSAGSVRASFVTYITPVVGVILGWAVLGESIGPNIVGGGALIAAGLATVMYGRHLRIAALVRWMAERRIVRPSPGAGQSPQVGEASYR